MPLVYRDFMPELDLEKIGVCCDKHGGDRHSCCSHPMCLQLV